MARQKKSPAFEQSLNDLQVLVERLESGDLSLEESLTTFEQGIALTRECQSALQNAEQRIQVLLEQNGTLTEKPLDGSLLP
ncbi:MAG: exodeoxyribonuclease VII small subunit [Pseudomonas sp.]|jgi:exodeoxyribonuclease VII small subunit|nr:exodeoxyribonuclease VII small subunit [Pseudomonas sp.]MDD2223879.1 exodeoxyribonuclease VII small subunit [Pseudomonas sp.]MDY0413646.1 exodeoxyribonuclease VII small subunit [Pseudomonas sp.]NLO54767.1 exodeoxyribonuclease VII small subunit [Gammaproteobacteria bacterium]